eukprot:6214243-Pleurochrysis_carterae.AAC.3
MARWRFTIATRSPDQARPKRDRFRYDILKLRPRVRPSKEKKSLQLRHALASPKGKAIEGKEIVPATTCSNFAQA